MKRGLIMEGGAMRGMFTCGVLDVFMENGVTFDGAAGISAGAVFGCNFKSHQIGRAIRYNKKYCTDPRFCGVRSLMKTGDLFGVDFCYHEIPDVLDPFDTETFKNDPMEFYVGATDIKKGEIVYHKCTDGGERDVEWMRASASLPLVSNPVKVDGYTLMDGGIVDPIPYRYMESIGYDRNVMILTQPKGFVKKKDKTRRLVRLKLFKYPAVAFAMAVRHIRYNIQLRDIAEREESGKAFVIRPPESLGIGRTVKDPEELERVYQVGRKEAERVLPEVISFLAGEE
ncbi:MAG: patatin family protein [Clostridia bacterium]|nr:patatin family protein [Clostridia bacterium]